MTGILNTSRGADPGLTGVTFTRPGSKDPTFSPGVGLSAIRSLNRRNTTPVRAFLLFLERLRYAVCERFEDLLKFFLYGFPALPPVECQDEYPDDWQYDSYDADSGDDDENRRDELLSSRSHRRFSNRPAMR